MQPVHDDMTEVRGVLVEAGASYYTVLISERRLKVPVHLIHKSLQQDDGSHLLTINTWFLRGMKVCSAALPTNN